MLTKNWKVWLGVLVAVLLAGGGLSVLLHFQGMPKASDIVAGLFNVLASAWIGWGLWVWRDESWVRKVNAIVLTTIGFSLAIALANAVGWDTGTRTLTYIYLAVMGFMVGMNLIRLIMIDALIATIAIGVLCVLVMAGMTVVAFYDGVWDGIFIRLGLTLAIAVGVIAVAWLFTIPQVSPLVGVARTMLEEAIRMRIALIFILMLLVLLPVLPLILGSEDRVTYMVQRFLTYSMMIVAALLSVMTVMLGARSVSHELSSKQVYMTLTKPLSRWQYLLGKWIGIGLLNVVLVSVSGVMIYGFTMAIAESPEMNRSDRATLDREILTARKGVEPEPYDRTNPNLSVAQIIFNLLEQKRQSDPERYGAPGTPTASLPTDVQQEIRGEALTQWLTIKPGQDKTFRFAGLGEAAKAARAAEDEIISELREMGLNTEQAEEYLEYISRERSILTFQLPAELNQEKHAAFATSMGQHSITLVISPDTSPAPANDMVEIGLRINGVAWPAPPTPTTPPRPMRMAIETPQEITLPATLIGDDGQLLLTIAVPRLTSAGAEQTPVQLNGKDATVEVFYRTGGFAGNLAKAMGVMWLRLCFLAAMGLAAGALLSFPVATLLCLIVLIMSVFSSYITEAVDSYASLPQTGSTRELVSAWFDRFWLHLSNGQLWDAVKLLIRLVASTILFLVPAISDFATNPFLSEGRQIPRELLVDAVWKMGLLWTGVVGLFGLSLFQRKELAKVVV